MLYVGAVLMTRRGGLTGRQIMPRRRLHAVPPKRRAWKQGADQWSKRSAVRRAGLVQPIHFRDVRKIVSPVTHRSDLRQLSPVIRDGVRSRLRVFATTWRGVQKTVRELRSSSSITASLQRFIWPSSNRLRWAKVPSRSANRRQW